MREWRFSMVEWDLTTFRNKLSAFVKDMMILPEADRVRLQTRQEPNGDFVVYLPEAA